MRTESCIIIMVSNIDFCINVAIGHYKLLKWNFILSSPSIGQRKPYLKLYALKEDLGSKHWTSYSYFLISLDIYLRSQNAFTEFQFFKTRTCIMRKERFPCIKDYRNFIYFCKTKFSSSTYLYEKAITLK